MPPRAHLDTPVSVVVPPQDCKVTRRETIELATPYPPDSTAWKTLAARDLSELEGVEEAPLHARLGRRFQRPQEVGKFTGLFEVGVQGEAGRNDRLPQRRPAIRNQIIVDVEGEGPEDDDGDMVLEENAIYGFAEPWTEGRAAEVAQANEEGPVAHTEASREAAPIRPRPSRIRYIAVR